MREGLSVCRSGDPLAVTKLDRLARSLPGAHDIVEELTAAEAKLNVGGSLHDPNDPIGRLLFNVLAMIAEFSVGGIVRHVVLVDDAGDEVAPVNRLLSHLVDAAPSSLKAEPGSRPSWPLLSPATPNMSII